MTVELKEELHPYIDSQSYALLDLKILYLRPHEPCPTLHIDQKSLSEIAVDTILGWTMSCELRNATVLNLRLCATRAQKL